MPGPGGRASTITLLSRAEEVGAGRLDALRAAGRVARRTASAPDLADLGSAALPVAGLIALTGRTLRHREVTARRSFAVLPVAETERLLLSADRFVRPGATDVPPPGTRAALIARLGVLGVRLPTSLVREGVADAGSLGAQLVRWSGLDAFQRLVSVQLTARADQLCVRSAAAVLVVALRRAPRPGEDSLWADLQRQRTATAGLAELDLLAGLSAAGALLPAARRPMAAQLSGSAGTCSLQRLGLPAGSDREEVRAAARAALADWQLQATDPLAPAPMTDAAEVVVRSLERVLAEVPAASGPVPAQPPPHRPSRQQQGAGHGEDTGSDQEEPVQLRAAGHHAADHQQHRHRGQRHRGQPPAGPPSAVQQQEDADAAEQDQDTDRREGGDQGGRDAVTHQVRRGVRVLCQRLRGQSRP